MKSGGRGFTLVEVLVSVTLLAVGIAAVMGAFAQLNAAEFRNRDAEKLVKLATQKLDELIATGQLQSSSQDGDFSDQGEPNYKWSLTTGTSTIENLTPVTVTVTKSGASDGWPQGKIDTLVFVPPTTTTTGAN